MFKLVKKWKKNRLDNAITAWKIDKETNIRKLAQDAHGVPCVFNIPDHKKKRSF